MTTYIEIQAQLSSTASTAIELAGGSDIGLIRQVINSSCSKGAGTRSTTSTIAGSQNGLPVEVPTRGGFAAWGNLDTDDTDAKAEFALQLTGAREPTDNHFFV
jgi:hypothetical protein